MRSSASIGSSAQWSTPSRPPWTRENACILVLCCGVGVARVCLQQSWAWQVPTTGLALGALGEHCLWFLILLPPLSCSVPTRKQFWCHQVVGSSSCSQSCCAFPRKLPAKLDLGVRQLTKTILKKMLSFLGLFNLRGSDVEHNPVFFSYAIVGLETIM